MRLPPRVPGVPLTSEPTTSAHWSGRGNRPRPVGADLLQRATDWRADGRTGRSSRRFSHSEAVSQTAALSAPAGSAWSSLPPPCEIVFQLSPASSLFRTELRRRVHRLRRLEIDHQSAHGFRPPCETGLLPGRPSSVALTASRSRRSDPASGAELVGRGRAVSIELPQASSRTRSSLFASVYDTPFVVRTRKRTCSARRSRRIPSRRSCPSRPRPRLHVRPSSVLAWTTYLGFPCHGCALSRRSRTRSTAWRPRPLRRQALVTQVPRVQLEIADRHRGRPRRRRRDGTPSRTSSDDLTFLGTSTITSTSAVSSSSAGRQSSGLTSTRTCAPRRSSWSSNHDIGRLGLA